MKVDKKMIDKVLKLNDEQLWSAIQIFAAKSDTPAIKSMEKPKDMSKIRSALSSLKDEDIDKIAEMLKKR